MVGIRGGQVRIGIEAPRSVVVSRRKVFDRIVEDGKSISAIALSTRDVYPNVPNGAVSIANCLIYGVAKSMNFTPNEPFFR